MVAKVSGSPIEESVVATREGHRCRPEPFGHRNARAAGHHRGRLRSDADDDAGPCSPERVEIVLVAGGGQHVQPQEWVVPGTVVLGREPEIGGIRTGLVSETGRDRALAADERDEFRHRRAKALAQVGLMDGLARGQRRLAVGQLLGGGRLVRHQGADLLRVPGHQGKPVDGAAAATEDVHRPGGHDIDQPVQVVGLLLDRGLRGAVGALAAPRPARDRRSRRCGR